MSTDAYITLAITAIAFILFTLDYFSVDQVAIGIMSAFALTGVLSIEQAVEGFSNRATLTVAAMFIFGDAIIKTGFIEKIQPWFEGLFKKSHKVTVGGFSSLIGGISAFINNTPVVATFIPLVTNISQKTNKNPAQYLMPLSFGAIFGGTCTLIGTSTNLLVDGIAQKHGLEGFSMFQFTPLGLVFFAVGTLYLMFFSRRLLPKNQNLEELERDKNVRDYLMEIEVKSRKNEYQEGEEKENEPLKIIDFFDEGDEKTEILRLFKDGELTKNPDLNLDLKKGDRLLVQGSLDQIKKVLSNDRLEMSESRGDRQFEDEATLLNEIVILPNSSLAGNKLSELNFYKLYRARVLAIRQSGKQMYSNLSEIKLEPGSILLLQSTPEGRENLREAQKQDEAPFLSLKEIGLRSINRKNLIILSTTLLAIITLATLRVVPILAGALAGIFILVSSRIISMKQAYQAIDWKVIILLAGALSLGAGMEQTGLDHKVAEYIKEGISHRYGTTVTIAALYLITSVFTEIMSNNASAALLAPIAISIASSLQVDASPFLMAIAFAGSASFMTPVGYQTNTMVYSAGNYNFKDFVKLGLPLNLIFWILASLLIPVFYPL